jgi:hypothetical protein
MTEPEQTAMPFYDEVDVTHGIPIDRERLQVLWMLALYDEELTPHEYAVLKMHPFTEWPPAMQEKLRRYGAETITTSRVRKT